MQQNYLPMKKILSLLLVCILAACQRPIFKESWLKETAPEKFSARFETSRGNFAADFVREWSPLAVDRLYSQIKHHAYDHTLFYRVRPNYVAQFGMDDSMKIIQWDKNKIPDEPVLQPNERGTISFARSGKDSRGSQVYMNLKNNSPRLDTLFANGVKGYPVIGKLNSGMEVVDSLYNGYGDSVFSKYETLMHNKPVFLQSYPKLDSISKVVLIRRRGTQ